jgi:hypothetical protein
MGETAPGMPAADLPGTAAVVRGTIAAVAQEHRSMPLGIQLFLAYAFLILAGVGLSLRYVVDLAVATPVTLPGVAAMALLAYTIFTVTLVLQRKEAARTLALGLATLTIPAVPLLLLARLWPAAVGAALLAVGLFWGLTRPAVRAWLSEP